MKIKKIIKPALILVLVFSWLLAGWPGIPFINFPPKIREAQAAHTLDTSVQCNNLATSPVNCTYTAGAGSTVLILHMMYAGTTARTGGTPTYNGVNLTQLDITRAAVESTIEVWYLIDPPTGSAYTLSIPNTGTRTIDSLIATAKAQSGYTSALDVVSGISNQSTANPSRSVTPTVNGAFITSFTGHGAAAPGTGNKTQYGGVWGYDSGALNYTTMYELQGTSGTTTHTFTLAADDWSMITAAFKEVVIPAVTTLSTSTDPGAATVAPASGIRSAGQFTYTTDAGSDTITALTLTLAGSPAGSYAAIDSVSIRDTSCSGTLYFSAVTPSSDSVSFSGGTALSATTGGNTYYICVTPKDHTLASGTYSVSPYVSSTWTSGNGNTKAGTDSNANALTIDNTAPSGATATSGTAGDTKVTLNWTTSSSSDFNTTSGSVVYRWAAASAGSEVPGEGSTPSAGDTNSTATVACVISSNSSTALSKIDGTGGSAGCTTTALTNGQSYTYKVFQKDNYGNYDAGVSIGTFTPAASGKTIGGNVYSDEGITAIQPSGVCAVVNSGTPECDTSVDANGYFEIATLSPNSGDQVTLYIDGGTYFGNTVIVSSGTNTTDFKIYANHVIVRHDTGTSISIAQMDAFDNSSGGNPTDMLFDATDSTTDTLTVEDGNELYIPSTEVFLPAGNLESGTDGIYDMKIVGTYTASTGEIIRISGAFTNSGTFTASTSTVKFDTPGAITLLSGSFTGSNSFYDLEMIPVIAGNIAYDMGVAFNANNNFTINPTSGSTNTLTATLGGNSTVTGTTLLSGTTSGKSTLDTKSGSNYTFSTGILNIGTPGTLNANNSNAITINGTSATIFSQAGVFNAAGSTLTISGSGAVSLTAATIFNNLSVTGTPTTSNSFTVNGTLTVSGSGNLSPSAGTITMAGTGWSISNSATLDFYGLTISETPTSQSGASYTISNALTVSSGKTLAPTGGTITFDTGTTTISNSGTLTFSGVTFNGTNTSNVSFSVNAVFTVGATGNFSPTGGTVTKNAGSISNSGTLVFANLSTTGTTTTSSGFTINGALSVGAGANLSPSAGIITMAGTGWSIANSGTLDFWGLTISETPTSQSGASYIISNAMTVSTGKTLAPTGGTITFDTTATSITNSGTLTFAGITVNGTTTTSSSFTINGALTVGATGNLSPSAGTVTLATTGWSIDNSGTLDFYGLTVSETPLSQPSANMTISNALTVSSGKTFTPTGTITMDTSATSISNSGTLTFTGLTANGAVSTGSNFTVNGALTVGASGNLSPSAGTITMATTGWSISNSNVLDFYGLTISETPTSQSGASYTISNALTVSAGKTLAPTTGTITFDTGTTTISNSGTLTFYSVTFNGTNTSNVSFTVANALTVGGTGNFSPAGGTITKSGGSISNSGTLAFVNVSITGITTTSSSFNVSGNFANSSTFTASAGTITLNGADSSTQAISGNSTFSSLTASTAGNSATRTIQYAGSSTTTVSGTWTMTGASGKVLNLQSSDTNNWTISPTTSSVDYTYLSRSTNTVGTICATHSTGDGNNSGYTITSGATCANSAPGTPTLDLPSDTATNQSTSPALKTTTTDSDSDYLQYKIILCENSGMTTNCQTFDQNFSQTGWSGQNANGNTAYTSGTQGTYTVQSALQNSFTYYWKSYAIDPAGTNTWSATQASPYSFTTQAPPSANQIPIFKGGIKLFGKTVIK